MNFLEELTAEWYEFNGYFCRTNIRFGKPKHGGYVGEMDVIAYHPVKKNFVHIECSGDSWSWDKKKAVIRKKFDDAAKYYKTEFPFEINNVQRIAITGYSRPRNDIEQKLNFGLNIKVILIPDFLANIAETLSKLDPWVHGIPETPYPLLRAIQQGTFYLKKSEKQKIKEKSKLF